MTTAPLGPSDPQFYEETPQAFDEIETLADGEPVSRDFTAEELDRGEDLGLDGDL